MSALDVAPPMSDPLLALHQRLLARYKDELRAARPEGPVFLLELELADDAWVELDLTLRVALRATPLDEARRAFWNQRYLPLLRVAAEVGYLYQGTGTDYWPVLSARLGVQMESDQHRELRRLFDAFGASCGVTVPDTAWARNFHNIARPITHAVLPRELHAPLLEALLGADPRRLADETWAELGPALRAQAEDMARRGRPGRRLGHFLEQGPVAEAVVRALALGETRSDHMAASALRRIRGDVLRADRPRELLKQVVARVRPAQPPRPVKPPRPAPAADPVRTCPLLLVMEGDRLSLDVQLPPSGHSLERAARRRVRLLGRGRVLSVDRLVLGGREPLLDVDLRALEPTTHPLLRAEDVEAITSHAALRRHLEGLRIDLSAPVLLAEHLGPDGTARQLRERAYADRDGYWLLFAGEPEDLPEGAVLHDDRPGGLRAVRLDTTAPGARRWLERLGCERVVSPRLRWLGAPPLGGRGAWEAGLVVGDPLLLRVEREPVEISGVQERLAPGLWRCGLPAEPARWAARLGGGRFDLTIPVFAEPESPSPAVEVALDGGAPTLQALAQRRLVARISGPLPLAGLRARLLLVGPEGALAEVETAPLPPLPAVIPSDDPCWATLARATEERALQDLSLRVEVGALASATWALPAPETELQWRGGSLVWEEDEREAPHPTLAWSAERPLAPIREAPSASMGFYLVAPLGEDGRTLAGLGRVLGPRRLVLGGLTVSAPDRVLRRLRAGEEDAPGNVGVMALVEALLRWSEATGAHQVAEVARRAVVLALDEQVTEALCGPAWTARERARDAADQALFGHVARALMATGLAVDEPAQRYLATQLPPADVESRVGAAVAEALRPLEGWLRGLVASRAVDKPATDAFWRALGVAYAAASRGLPPYPPEASPDFSLDAEDLTEALREAHAAWTRARAWPTLLTLVHPSELAHEGLGGLDYDGLDLDELASALTRWLRARPVRTRAWTHEEARALLGVWTPGAEAGRVNLAALEGALADRFAARAVRYAALRWRAARGLGGR